MRVKVNKQLFQIVKQLFPGRNQIFSVN